MSLLEKKHDCQIIRWKPFATSTPLKPISTNAKVKNGICPVRPSIFVPSITKKASHVSKNIQNKQPVKSKIKITGKNRSGAYFDLSSSSSDDDDDDCLVKNRPIIKIGTENTDKVKVVAVNEKGNVAIKVTKNSSSIRRKAKNAKSQNSKCETQQEQENKVENGSVTSNLNLENVDANANHEKSLPVTVNLSSENDKSKFVHKSKKKENLINKVKCRSTTLEVNDENHEKVKNMQRLLKRKGTQNKNTVGGKKGREMQAVLTEKSANSSHQLFTDSIQEELISTLCLISPEVVELTNLNFSKVSHKSITELGKNNIVKPANSNEYETIKETADDVEKQERPKRTRQAPKKYWLINEKPKLLKDKSKCTRISRKKPATQNECIPNQASDTVAGKNLSITQTAPESKKIPAGQSVVTSNCHNQGIKKPEPILRKKKDKGPLIDTKLENSAEHPVFVSLKEVSYLENEFGHQFSQIWSFNNFKCGIFKLKPGSNFTWEKSQESVYMGGVLIKGEMKMTIEGKENVLQEGDTVLVPPMSNYQASNTGECDSVFYYWTFNK